MSGAYRPLRSLFRSPRILSRLQSGQTIRVERVRIKKQKPATRFVSTVFKGVIALQLLSWAVAPRRGEAEDSSNNSSTSRGAQEYDDDEDDEPLFIPFPFTTVTHPPQPYPRNSPVWHEFKKVAQDQKLQDAIRRHTADYVVRIARLVVFPKLLPGTGGDARLRRAWIDLYYPTKAPPVIERSGILITDEGLEWATMPVDPFLAKRLERILWPKPLAMGFWALGTETVKRISSEVAKVLGLASDTPNDQQAPPRYPLPPTLPTTPSPEVQKALQQYRQRTARRPEEANNNTGPIAPSASAAPATPAAPGEKNISVSNNASPSSDDKQDADGRSKVSEAVLGLVRAVQSSEPMKRFKEAYAKNTKPIVLFEPPGCLAVKGLIEVESSAGIIKISIDTWYDPKRNELVHSATSLEIRSFVRRRSI